MVESEGRTKVKVADQDTQVQATIQPVVQADTQATATEVPTQVGEAVREAKTVMMPTAAIKRIRQEERRKGRTEALAELDNKAKTLGYRSWEHMEKVLAAQKGKKAQPSRSAAHQQTVEVEDPEDKTVTEQAKPVQTRDRAPATPVKPDRELLKLQRANARLLEEKRKANRARAHEEKQRRSLQRTMDAKDVEHQLRLVASQSGISSTENVDYAIHMLRMQMSGKSEAELQQFDERKFFADLRNKMPYLFGVQEQSANTSVTPATAQARPAPVKRQETETSDKDARKLSSTQYADRLRQLGLTPPSAGSPV